MSNHKSLIFYFILFLQTTFWDSLSYKHLMQLSVPIFMMNNAKTYKNSNFLRIYNSRINRRNFYNNQLVTFMLIHITVYSIHPRHAHFKSWYSFCLTAYKNMFLK